MWNIYLYFIILKLFTNFQNINFFCQNRSSLRYIANKKILIYIYRWNKTAWWWSFTICIFYQWHMDWWHFIKPDINIQQLSVVCIIDVIRLSFIVIYNLINQSCDIKILIYFFFNSTLADDFYFTYIDISNPVDYRGYVCDVTS
jgi:hypothetical protein